MKRLLTLALVFAVMAAFAGLSAGQGAQKKDPQKSPSTSSAMSTKNSAHATEQIVTGKVLSVNPKDKTFTVVANGKQVTFFANKLLLPDVGKMMDIHYIQQTPGGPMEATTIQPTPGGTFAVTNLNSSRSNISRSDNTSATSKAMEPPPEKPKQEISISESGTMSSYRTATPEQMVTGKVLSVNPKDKTFTVETSGKQVTFFANQLKLPDVGKMMDIHYIQPTPGGPMKATSIQPTNGGTFAVTNLNSSRSNISVAGDTSATSKAIEPPPQKPKQEASISESGTMSSFRTATCPNVMTGKVLRVKKEDNTFTVMSKGKEVTLFAGKLNLPKAGEIMDICYTPKTPGGPFTVINLNSSRSNIY